MWTKWTAVAVAVCGAVLLLGADKGSESKPAASEAGKEKVEWTALFDGKTLDGWKAEGNAAWSVEDGVLVGKQGPGNAPGDLFTAKEYGDFVVKLEYRVQWPANSGVWFRYQSPEKSYQADILEYKDPVAYSGTLYSPGKMFLAANLDPKLEKKEEWNSLKIRAKGSKLSIELNGVKTAEVEDNSYDRGRIGFQIHPGDEFKDMKLEVRNIELRELK